MNPTMANRTAAPQRRGGSPKLQKSWEGFDFLWSGYGSYQPFEEAEAVPVPDEQQDCFSDFAAIDDVQFDNDLMVLQLIQKRTPTEPDPEQPLLSETTSKLPGHKEEEEEEQSEISYEQKGDDGALNNEKKRERTIGGGGQVLSAEDVMKIASTHYIQMLSHQESDLTSLGLNLPILFPGYGDHDIENLRLAVLLLAATEMVSKRQYDCAGRLVTECQKSSCDTSNPVRRIIFYFSRALMERMERETDRRAPPTDPVAGDDSVRRVVDALANPHPLHLVTHRLLPFSQVMHFTAVQTILDSVASARRIHLVDLGIKIGVQWSILMQALAVRSSGCAVERLKISAVGTSEAAIRVTGRRLASFAESLSLRFEFRAVVVADMGDLRADMFETEEGEAVGVYCSLVLSNMLVRPHCLENLVGVLRELRPCVITHIDVHVNNNSASFLSRSVELLFSYSAFFDCLEACMGRDDRDRKSIEADFFFPGMRNVVAAEGSERVLRHVGLGVWRAFFSRFGLVEAELSGCSVYQAGLLLKQFACGHHCTLDMDKNSLMVGWKGRPMFFVTAWKFQDG